MKWHIHINQRAFFEFNQKSEIQLNWQDGIIMNWLAGFYSEPKSMKIVIDEQIFVWSAYGHIIKENPLLNIASKTHVGRKFKQLVDAKIIIKHTSKDHGNKVFFAPTTLFNKMMSKDYKSGDLDLLINADPSHLSIKPSIAYDETIARVTTKPSQAIDQTVASLTMKPSYNNTIIDNYIKKYIREKETRAFGFLIESSVDRVFDWLFKNQKQIQDIERMIDSFDNKVDIEGMEYTSKKLIARLNNFTSSWIYNSHNNKFTNNQNNEPAILRPLRR